MRNFLLFIVGVFVILIIISTIFGKGLAYNILGFVAESEPSFLQEEIRNILSVASQFPGELETSIKIIGDRNITIDDEPPTVLVETSPRFRFSQNPTEPLTFLKGNCEIIKKCTKTCGFIGDGCADGTCCSGLICESSTHLCKSPTCGNGVKEPYEECDDGDSDVCPTQCQADCTCSRKSQCDDGIDNDLDGKIDSDDPTCGDPKFHQHEGSIICGNGLLSQYEACDIGSDGIPGNEDDLDSACPGLCQSDCTCNLNTENDFCKYDANCTGGENCVSKTVFPKMGGWLKIKKYFEGYKCKIKVERA